MKPTIVAATILMACLPTKAAAREYVNAKFKSIEHPVRKVLVLPARVELTKVGMKGSEGMAEESEKISKEIAGLVVKQLEGTSVKVLPNPFTEEALRANDELQQTLNRIQSKYDTLAIQLHRKPKEVKKGRYTLGDEVATLGPAAEADAIVFIRGNGTILTGGKKAFGMLVAGPAANVIRNYVSFADARNGNVLAVVDFVKAGNYQKNTDKAMSKTLTKSFQKIPFAR